MWHYFVGPWSIRGTSTTHCGKYFYHIQGMSREYSQLIFRDIHGTFCGRPKQIVDLAQDIQVCCRDIHEALEGRPRYIVGDIHITSSGCPGNIHRTFKACSITL